MAIIWVVAIICPWHSKLVMDRNLFSFLNLLFSEFLGGEINLIFGVQQGFG